MITHFKAALAGVAAFAAVSSVQADTIYQWSQGAGNFGSNGASAEQRSFNSLSTSYNATQQTLSFANDFGDAPADGFWLVISDGPNAKGNPDKYAILFGDLDAGTIKSYVYDGANSASSFGGTPTVPSTFGLTKSADGQSFSFTIDVSDLNDPSQNGGLAGWKGAQFGSLLGLWYHPAWGSIDLDAHNPIFSPHTQAWRDFAHYETTVVPVPAAIWLFGSGLVALAGLRRRRSLLASRTATHKA